MRPIRTNRFTQPTLCFSLFLLAHLGSEEEARSASVGLSPVGAQRFGNEDLLIFVPEEGDRFAWSLATGDFNGDGADDLVSGMPYDDGFGVPDSGLVVVRYGSPGSGLETGSPRSPSASSSVAVRTRTRRTMRSEPHLPPATSTATGSTTSRLAFPPRTFRESRMPAPSRSTTARTGVSRASATSSSPRPARACPETWKRATVRHLAGLR